MRYNKTESFVDKIYDYLTCPDSAGRPADVWRRKRDLLYIARNPEWANLEGAQEPPFVTAFECDVLEARLDDSDGVRSYGEIAKEFGIHRTSAKAICERKARALFRWLEAVRASGDYLAFGPKIDYAPAAEIDAAFNAVGAQCRRAKRDAYQSNMEYVRRIGAQGGHIDGGPPPDPHRERALSGFITKHLDEFDAKLWAAYLDDNRGLARAAHTRTFQNAVATAGGGEKSAAYGRDTKTLIENFAERVVALEVQFNFSHRAIQLAA